MKLMTNALTLMGTAALFMSTTISAQAAFIENEYICEDAYMEVAFDCGKNAVTVEKTRLNKIYISVYRTLNNHQKAMLDKEQLAWLKTRNDKCYFEHDGPMNNSIVYAMINADVCPANETQKRSKTLVKKYNMQ